MKMVVVRRHGGPEVMAIEDGPSPRPGMGQVLVDVVACGVNFRDVYERTGAIAGGPNPPYVPGVEGAGRIVSLGDGVDELAVGDRVAWISAPGSYADRLIVEAARVVRVPSVISEETAAAALLQGITAQYLSSSCHPVDHGERVLIHAAAGGVGGLLTQVVRSRGGRVLATGSTPEKRERARSLGAEAVARYDDVIAASDAFTSGKGMDVVYDGVGADTFAASLECLKPRGTMVLFGQSSGPVGSILIEQIARKALFLTRPSLRFYTASPDELTRRAHDVFDAITLGALQVKIGGTYHLADAPVAHIELESRRTSGKLILRPAN